MPRESQYGSDAEKQAAYRARKAAYESGYAGEDGHQWEESTELVVEWAKGVWQRQADRMTAGAAGKQEARPRPEREKKGRR